MTMTDLLPSSLLLLALLVSPEAADAQQAAASGPAAQQHYDLNVYPVLNAGNPFDLNAAPAQAAPAGTIPMTSTAPAPAYSFKDVLANTHGFVETGVSSRGGYDVSGGVSIPILPGKAELDLAAGTGKLAGWGKTPSGKTPLAVYDQYSAGLHFHPTDDTEAYIGITGLRLHAPTSTPGYPFGFP